MDARPSDVQQTEQDKPRQLGPVVAVLIAWILGILLGNAFGGVSFWLLAGASSLALGLMVYWRLRHVPHVARFAIRFFAMIAAGCAAAAWHNVRVERIADDHIAHYLDETSQLALVTGVVDSRVNLNPPQRGAFASFTYQSPVTMFALRVDSIVVDGRPVSTRGRLFVKVEQADHRLREGMYIEAVGWLAAIGGPNNPGELDYRRIMADRDIDGRLTLRRRGNWRVIEGERSRSLTSTLASWRRALRDEAAAALHAGLPPGEERRAFLDALLIGRRSGDAGELSDAFRRVGLAHLLSISGAHLAILLGLTWLVVKLFVPNPRRSAVVVGVVLVFYLCIVPVRVPILRAAIMAGLFCAAYGSGRLVSGTRLIALAALIVLIWRPGDLFTAGFQLSFGVVAALLAFADPLSKRLSPEPEVRVHGDRTAHTVARFIVGYFAANIVAFLVAWPIVAYHFQLISPLTVVLSLMALPVVTVVLGFGYLKVIVGMALPTVGKLLAGPLSWSADAMTGLVEHAATWPGAAVELNRTPSLVWLLATLGVTLAWFTGALRGRRVTLICALLACVAWLFVSDRGLWFRTSSNAANPPGDRAALRINMFAVGDGSCYLVRVDDAQRSGIGTGQAARTLMFDCGSQAFYDVGRRSVAPALRHMGVSHLDILVLSHADLDHFGGVLDVLDAVSVGQVYAPPQLIAEANDRPDGTAAFLVDRLRERRVVIKPMTRGWQADLGYAQLSTLWPPADLEPKRANDSSIVLSIRTSNRRLLLNGDIQQDAIESLLELEVDLKADVTDLPHHGSFVDASLQWFKSVQPQVALQSSGPTRLYNDRWRDAFEDADATRLITARHGMVEVRISHDGTISWSTFRPRPGTIHADP